MSEVVGLSSAAVTTTSSNLDPESIGHAMSEEIRRNPEEVEEIRQSERDVAEGRIRWLDEPRIGTLLDAAMTRLTPNIDEAGLRADAESRTYVRMTGAAVLVVLDRLEDAEEALSKARFTFNSYAAIAKAQRGCPNGCPCTDCEFAEDLCDDLGLAR